MRFAAQGVREELARTVAQALEVSPDELTFAEGQIMASDGRSIPFEEAIVRARQEGRDLSSDYVYQPPTTTPLGEPGDEHFAYGYATQAALVEVDTKTGEVKVLEVIAAHDVGRALNPLAIAGQLEGGVAMGMGFALSEELQVEEGFIRNANLAKYKIPRVREMPEVVPTIVEERTAEGPFGAKGVGEITSIPTAPATINAIYHACGIRILTLPATPERLLSALLR